MFFFVVICFILLVARLVQIYVNEGTTYEKKVLSLLNYDGQTVPYRRGDITDRNGTVLATSEKVYTLILDPYVLNNSTNDNAVECAVDALHTYFDLDKDEVRSLIEDSPDSRYIILKRQMSYDEKLPYDEFLTSEDEADQAAAEAIGSGIWFEESYNRVYPFSTLACDVIGFTSSDNVGQWGLENYYNDELSGINGRKYGYLTDDVDLEKVTQEAVDGETVVSTIDISIQRIAEKYIAQFMEETGAANVAAIVMDPNNGEILAMASSPVYDLNHPQDMEVAGYSSEELEAMSSEELSEVLYSVWNNFCVNTTFEPGSTVKTMTVSYGLDQGAAAETDQYYCDGGELYTEDHTYVSCNSYHGELTLEESLMYSCNDAMMQISEELGTESFVQMQQMFGLGQKTGIDLPGEPSCESLIYTEETMGPVEMWTSSFGQGFNTTMIQVAAAFCSIVNGGYYYQPHIVKELQTSGGSTVEVFDKVLCRMTISEETSEWMKEALYMTVEEGSGTPAKVSGYRIGGKTGTAEKLPRGGDERLVSFIGAAPIDDPQVVVYVIVDEANVDDQGQSSFASGIAKNIFAEVLPYLQIFPTEEVETEEAESEELTDAGEAAGSEEDADADGGEADEAAGAAEEDEASGSEDNEDEEVNDGGQAEE